MIDLQKALLGCDWQEGRVHVSSPVFVGTEELPPAHARGAQQRYCGDNTIAPDCVQVACINYVINTKASLRPSEPANFMPVPVELGLQIYKDVNHADPLAPGAQGTDPVRMFEWWKENPILGFKLKRARAIDPHHEDGVKLTILRRTSAFFVVKLTQAQQAMGPWGYEEGSPLWGYHAICGDEWMEALLAGTSWGQEQILKTGFISHQLMGVYDLEIEAI